MRWSGPLRQSPPGSDRIRYVLLSALPLLVCVGRALSRSPPLEIRRLHAVYTESSALNCLFGFTCDMCNVM